MTNENIIKQLKRLIPSLQYADDVNAVKGAIQALSQEPTISRLERRVDDNTVVFRTIDGEEVEYVRKEPCDDTVSIRKDVLKCRVGNIVAYNVEWLKKHWQMEMDIVCGVKPCDDAISRDAALEKMADYVASGYADSVGDFEEYSRIICQLPSVTQKSAKDYLDMADRKAKKIKDALTVTQRSGKWIPVNERLPEDRRAVLVTAYWHETYQVMMASYYGDGLWWCVPFNNCGEHMQRLKPKAWMPLPKPYEPQERSEE